MVRKGLTTTVQEYKGKFTTPIPMALIELMGIEKGDTLKWTLNNGDILVKVVKP